jgi:hypothetical protein
MAFLQLAKKERFFIFVFCKQVSIIFYLHNEHRRKTIQKETTENKRRKVRETKRIVEFFQHFAFVV